MDFMDSFPSCPKIVIHSLYLVLWTNNNMNTWWLITAHLFVFVRKSWTADSIKTLKNLQPMSGWCSPTVTSTILQTMMWLPWRANYRYVKRIHIHPHTSIRVCCYPCKWKEKQIPASLWWMCSIDTCSYYFGHAVHVVFGGVWYWYPCNNLLMS